MRYHYCAPKQQQRWVAAHETSLCKSRKHTFVGACLDLGYRHLALQLGCKLLCAPSKFAECVRP